LTATAVHFLAANAWPILDPALQSGWASVCRVITWGAWAAFAVDYVVRLVLSRGRGRFIRQNLLDLAVAPPAPPRPHAAPAGAP